jgi:MFS family permease
MNDSSPPRRELSNLGFYFVSFLTGDAAAQILGVSVAWNVYQIHHRAFDLGLVGLVMFAPMLALVLVTGHVADRYDRKRTLMLTIVAEAVLALVLGGLIWFDVSNLALVLGIVLAIGIERAFAAPLEATILVSLIDSGDYLRVQARYNSLRELVVITAPAAGGAIVAASPLAGYTVAAALTLVAAATLGLVRVPRSGVALDVRFTWSSSFEGIRFIRSRPVLLGAVSLDLFAVLFGGATALLPVYADAILHVGAFGFGLLRGASGVGASLMALFLSRHPPKRHVGRTLLVAVAGYGIATIVFAYSRSLWLSIAALAAAGALDMISVVIRRGLVQLNTPDAMRGRVNAVEMVFIGASYQVGSFESGTAAQLLGVVPSVAIGGLLTLVVVAIWAKIFPQLRRSDEFVADVEA